MAPESNLETRLRALDDYAILDTAHEPAFDDIVAVAKELCGTPVVLVSFVVEDRQWFKARAGVDLSETPLSHSVCIHALAQGSTLIIPDLSKDERTRANPLVVGEPFIRFYAGALLRASGGEDLGTLCVIDTKPRPAGLTVQQTAALEALARQVVQLMELRRLVAIRDSALADERVSRSAVERRASESEALREQIRERQSRAVAAQEAGRIGTFEAVVGTGAFHTSAEMCRIFGLPEAEQYPASAFEQLIIPEDRGASSTDRSRSDGTATSFAEYRIRRANDGALRWLTRRGDFVRGAGGRIVSFTGVVHDITERKLVERRQAALIQLSDEIRDATSSDEIVRSAARLLGETLELSRAGYARIDIAANTLSTDIDWTSGDIVSVRGTHAVDAFAETIAQLEHGRPVVVADTNATDWLADDLPAYAAFAIRAHISVPLGNRGLMVGILYAHSETPRYWSSDEVVFVQSLADRAYAAIAKVEAEDRQRVLNSELSHRLKNTLALVQAIATRTLKATSDRHALQDFQNRLIALSKAHDVLLDQDWKSGRIRDVADAVLPLHVEAAKLSVSGPNISIGSRAVLSLSMLFHELATNAVKHGALSSDAGIVAVSWKVDSASSDADMVLTWDETGGPPVSVPEKRGMGSRLIEAGLVGTGGSVVRYQPSGFSAEFRAPLSQLTDK